MNEGKRSHGEPKFIEPCIGHVENESVEAYGASQWALGNPLENTMTHWNERSLRLVSDNGCSKV